MTDIECYFGNGKTILTENRDLSSLPNVFIEDSTDVVIGTVTHVNGPIVINAQDESPAFLQHLLLAGGAEENKGSKPQQQEQQQQQKQQTLQQVRRRDKIKQILEQNRLTALASASAFLGLVIGLSVWRGLAPEKAPPPAPVPKPKCGVPCVSRDQWRATDANNLIHMDGAVRYVVVAQSAPWAKCTNSSDCQDWLRNIQSYHMGADRRCSDVGFNFFIGGDGLLYEGRGWGRHSFYANVPDNLAVTFSGNYSTDRLDDAQVDRMWSLLTHGVDEGLLKNDYKIVALQNSPDNQPGQNIMERMVQWVHYSNETFPPEEKLCKNY